MTESGSGQNEPYNENNSANPKWNYPVWICWIGRKIRSFLDGLNYVSPFLTAVATALIAWVAIWQWNTLEKTESTLSRLLKKA
jgi:hypothetical protein